MIFKVGVSKNVHGLASVPIGAQETFTSHRILAHPQGFVGQVAWSPSGHLLLTKLGRGVKIWTEVCCSARRFSGSCTDLWLCACSGRCVQTDNRPTSKCAVYNVDAWWRRSVFLAYTHTDLCTDADDIHQRSYLLRAAM